MVQTVTRPLSHWGRPPFDKHESEHRMLLVVLFAALIVAWLYLIRLKDIMESHVVLIPLLVLRAALLHDKPVIARTPNGPLRSPANQAGRRSLNRGSSYYQQKWAGTRKVVMLSVWVFLPGANISSFSEFNWSAIMNQSDFCLTCFAGRSIADWIVELWMGCSFSWNYWYFEVEKEKKCNNPCVSYHIVGIDIGLLGESFISDYLTTFLFN